MKKKKGLSLVMLGVALGVLVVLFGGILVLRRTNPMIDQLASMYSPPGSVTPDDRKGPTLPPRPMMTASKTVHVPILLYHYVEVNQDVRDTIRTSLAVTPYWFEKQLQYLKENGYNAIDFGQLRSAILGYNNLPKNPVIITFDDGYRDFYTDAYPLLKKYNIKATIYVISDFLDRPNYMFSWQLQEIAAQSANLISIGAHTQHHMYLPALKADAAWQEIFESKRELETKLNVPVTDFAYPYGAFDNNVIELIRKAGFKSAVSTLFGSSESTNNLYFLPRIRVGNYDGKVFQSRLTPF